MQAAITQSDVDQPLSMPAFAVAAVPMPIAAPVAVFTASPAFVTGFATGTAAGADLTFGHL